jgi:hypothetical protein
MRRITGEFDQVATTFILPPKNDFECPALTCRSPAHAYGPPNGLAVQLGDRNSRQGARAVPSLSYVLNRTPIWNKEFIANPVERILEGEEPPTGGSLGTAVSTLSTNRPPSLWPPTRWPTLDRRKQVRMPMTFEDSSDQTSSMIPPGLCRDAHCDRALRAGGR